ncbi:MAG: hypothetical protein DCC71_24980, partial [Proteobacteria bacterium]
EAAARAGERRGKRAANARGGARAAARRVDVLKGIARAHAAVAEAIEPLDWLDDLVEEDLHRAALAARRAGERPDPQAALAETLALFESTLRAVAAGRALLARLEQRLGAAPARVASA